MAGPAVDDIVKRWVTTGSLAAMAAVISAIASIEPNVAEWIISGRCREPSAAYWKATWAPMRLAEPVCGRCVLVTMT